MHVCGRVALRDTDQTNGQIARGWIVIVCAKAIFSVSLSLSCLLISFVLKAVFFREFFAQCLTYTEVHH